LDRGQLAIVGIARYEAEVKIAARKRMNLGPNQQQQEPTTPVEEVPADTDSHKGESAVIIAQKAGVKTGYMPVQKKGYQKLKQC